MSAKDQVNKEEVLAKFKSELQADGLYKPDAHDDALLYRFLRARKYDIPKSKLMFSTCEKWREEFHVSDVVATFTYPEGPEVRKYYPRFYHKTDKVGRPVYFEQMGFIDMKKLFEITTPERMIKVYVREYEKFLNYRLAACSAKKGVKLEQSCTILDLKGVPLTQFGAVKKLVSQVSEIAQNYYPETLGKMFIINAPTLFTTVWAVVKLMLDENTVNKISILGSSYQKQLLECIDADCLPASYGGTCRCPNGCETGDVGPWNDGSVPGFPKPEFEDYTLRDMASRDTQASS